MPGQSHKPPWRSLTCEMNWVTHPEEEVSNKKPDGVLLCRTYTQDRNTSSFEEPSSLVLHCLDELNCKGKSNSNKTSRNECRKKKYASLNNFDLPIIQIVKIQNRCVDSALTMSKCSLSGQVQLSKCRQVMISETTRICCLASAGLSGRGRVYPGSCIRSASPM